MLSRSLEAELDGESDTTYLEKSSHRDQESSTLLERSLRSEEESRRTTRMAQLSFQASAGSGFLMTRSCYLQTLAVNARAA